ncbi:hypothetical protein LTR37_012801 [Vermiconidia calcicola]|uniref:Uncharacterized protein n=1 Tax=Vermiconidia calcicola TaxID=1690605 RepID=A0ACC3MYG2_9PEZI|nr:hypothetical protein LTR37_012801 [Vermiconidia calcicola]
MADNATKPDPHFERTETDSDITIMTPKSSRSSIDATAATPARSGEQGPPTSQLNPNAPAYSVSSGYASIRPRFATAAELPAGWEQRRTTENRVYFVDHNTCTTTPDHPRLQRSKAEGASNTNAGHGSIKLKLGATMRKPQSSGEQANAPTSEIKDPKAENAALKTKLGGAESKLAAVHAALGVQASTKSTQTDLLGKPAEVSAPEDVITSPKSDDLLRGPKDVRATTNSNSQCVEGTQEDEAADQAKRLETLRLFFKGRPPFVGQNKQKVDNIGNPMEADTVSQGSIGHTVSTASMQTGGTSDKEIVEESGRLRQEIAQIKSTQNQTDAYVDKIKHHVDHRIPTYEDSKLQQTAAAVGSQAQSISELREMTDSLGNEQRLVRKEISTEFEEMRKQMKAQMQSFAAVQVEGKVSAESQHTKKANFGMGLLSKDLAGVEKHATVIDKDTKTPLGLQAGLLLPVYKPAEPAQKQTTEKLNTNKSLWKAHWDDFLLKTENDGLGSKAGTSDQKESYMQALFKQQAKFRAGPQAPGSTLDESLPKQTKAGCDFSVKPAVAGLPQKAAPTVDNSEPTSTEADAPQQPSATGVIEAIDGPYNSGYIADDHGAGSEVDEDYSDDYSDGEYDGLWAEDGECNGQYYREGQYFY